MSIGRPRALEWLLAAAFLLIPACRESDPTPSRTTAALRPAAYTSIQASRGGNVYAARCAGCHGERLQGAAGPALTGAGFLHSWSAYSLSVDELYYVTRTTMPKGSKRLARQEYLDVVAYILERNDYPAGRTELTENIAVMRAIKLASPDDTAAKRPVADPLAPARAPTTTQPTQAELERAVEARDWIAPEHDYAGTKHSPLEQINRANVQRLRPVCVYQVGGQENFQTMPIVRRGVMYFTTPRLTIALDARTCRPRWKRDWPEEGNETFPRNRGVALKDGRIVRGTTDGQLIALDAASGDLLWARRVADAFAGETFTMPPLIYDSLVLIGPGVSEHGMSGWIGAFSLTDGKPLWRFETIRRQTGWEGSDSIVVGGASVWTPVTLDPTTGTLYVATANPVPDYAGHVRRGDNLYTNSLLALDVRTGSLRWFRQMVAHDTHDWDFTHAGPLFQANIHGTMRDAIATVGKDGVLRTLDRRSGALLYETPVTTRENTEAPLTAAGTHTCAGFWGGVEWNGPAYHPTLRTLFVNAVDWCSTFFVAQEVRHIPGRNYMGGRTVLDSIDKATGWLTAVDAASGSTRWRYRSAAPLVAALTVTGGGLVFTGELTGDLIALDARAGEVLYRFNTGGPIGAGVITYAVDRKQYIAVMSGRPSRFSLGRDPGAPTVMVFGLP